MGRPEDVFEAATLHTVKDVWRMAAGDRPFDEVLCAINQEYAQADARVSDGDEVAFFPPVTGG